MAEKLKRCLEKRLQKRCDLFLSLSFSSLSWLEIQEEAGEPQPTTAQEHDVKEEGGEPSQPETRETEEATAPAEKGKEEDEEPKPKPHPARTRVRSCVPNVGIDLAIGESGVEAEEPITVGQLFKTTVERFPTHPALKYKEDGTWKTITYTGYYEFCIRAAKSFLKVRVAAV